MESAFIAAQKNPAGIVHSVPPALGAAAAVRSVLPAAGVVVAYTVRIVPAVADTGNILRTAA